ncbi:hypothetical protein, partial [Collinsella ihumii]|uniref:hypothetical protein n=1 Tax=Collinsella ihumii TaxID=1720204 RepID=UPI0025AA5BDA
MGYSFRVDMTGGPAQPDCSAGLLNNIFISGRIIHHPFEKKNGWVGCGVFCRTNGLGGFSGGVPIA